ncbi:hypothetical protein DFQ27_001089 [Actinomortierella ambigua]|uniref:Uncharacterized protein n=1 Tax=Actinomortierella ambigua TaxID=1343610 RepID=A0A9P6QB23_9FUNG|nr:hypothetical protein DFQ27_001089 [Actinomortierella ambigua]
MTIADIRQHLLTLAHPDFNATTYHEHGYVLNGTLKSDGHLLQFGAFKLHEPLAARLRRLPDERMPSSWISTLGGTHQYLSEVRNVVKSSEDVKKI